MNSYRSLQLFGLAALLWITAACTPPTPPPSPTPWPSDTPTPAETDTPVALSTARPTATLTPSATPTPGVVTLTVWESLPETQSALLAQDAADFQEAFPQMQVKLQHYDGPESFMTSLTAGEHTFDLILTAAPLLDNLRTTEKIAPINELFPPSFLNSFAAATLGGASYDEQLWGVPDTTGFHLLLFYNRALVETPPETMAEVFDLADATSSGSPSTLALNSSDPVWLLPWLAAAGSWPVDEEGRPTLDPEAAEAALELYLDWHDPTDGLAAVQTYEEMRRAFVDGNAGLMIDGEWAIRELQAVPDISWGVTLLPAVEIADNDSQPAAPLILGRYWAISSALSGDKTVAATTFLEFVTEPERQLVWTERFGLLPTHRQALDNPQIVNDSVLRVDASQMLAGRSVPLGINANTLLDALRGPLEAALAGEMTAQEAAEAMQLNLESVDW